MKTLDKVRDLGSRARTRALSWVQAVTDIYALVLTAVVVWVTERPRLLAVIVAVGQTWNRCAATVMRVVRWSGWAVAAQVTARTVRAIRRWVWSRTRQPVLDAAGWVRHRAPALLWQGLRIVARHAPRVAWWVATRAGIGGWWVLSRTLRWCTAITDYADLVRQVRDDQRHGTAKRLRNEWTRTALVRSAVTLIVSAVTSVLAVKLAEKAGQGVVIAVVVAVFAAIGHVVRPAPILSAVPDLIEDGAGPEDPYPLADAHTRAEAADCVARALRAEGVALRMAGEAVRERWGWTVPVVLRKGTPAAIVGKAADLETTLDLPAGGVLATADRTRRARVVLRLAERDPFATLPPALRRAPGSVSIRDRLTVGGCIDGADLALSLLGVHGVVIGNSGAGKTGALRSIADALTACRDAVVWDLDPAGVGQAPLAPALGRIERTRAGIEDALADALAYAEVRPRLMPRLGMSGADWVVSPEHPAVVILVDEYSRMSDTAKASAVELLRVGRKARVSLILAASEATSDTLGDAIADTTALKILLPCRGTDVRLVFGQGRAAEGWRPDRLNPATADDPQDAGRAYVDALHHREPLLSKFRTVDDTEAATRAAERAPHRPQVDTATLAGARALRHPIPALGPGTGTSAGGTVVDVDRRTVADVLAVFGTDDRLWTTEVLARLSTMDDRYTGWTADRLSTVLRPLGVTPGQVWRDGRNRNGYTSAAIAAALHSGGGR
ncbi:hypothetical protein [Umezawaea sp. Da 62-37]|uniref:hypothetical protein n=1 Tax=Umezawaea sp. Da 62-37 TaxID=3075927 RepID=UPI0028F6C0E8|nr:hypothetical protein [Umezawaea sp. Da 62-37]WNV83851.1 hypothetical protein RM788_37605 [Umezawaea sp. Da 62-37]